MHSCAGIVLPKHFVTSWDKVLHGNSSLLLVQVADVEGGDTTPPTSMDMAPATTAYSGNTVPMHNVDVLKTSPP